jgi:two-component system sensor histidine kinase TctE
MNNPISLRTSLTRRLALALASIGVIGTVAAYNLASSYANLAYDRAQFDDVATLAEQISIDQGRIQLVLPVAALKWLLADEGEIVRYRVTDLRNRTIIASNGDLGSIPDDPGVNGQPAYRYADANNLHLRIASMRHVVDPTDVPVLIEIGETTGKRDNMTRGILAGTMLFMATMIAVAVALVWRGIGMGLAPLKTLESEAAQRSGTDLAPLDPLHAPIEVRGLIDAINRLMTRVESTMELQSHFIANAAHQLRTPLAGLQLQAQLAAKATSPEAMHASLVEVERSAVRTSHLVEQLLVLAKVESADPREAARTVVLDALAQQVIERYLPLADQRSIDLGYQGSARSLHVAGNAIIFGELLGNLVDNALRYGRAGGRVTVELMDGGDQAIIRVVDDGPGFDNVDIDIVCQRFHQTDAAGTAGAGLGLAIVREITDRYGGTLTLHSSPGNGSCFELRFPRMDLL